MISLVEARRTVLEACRLLPPILLPVGDALGCASAADVTATTDIPGFTNSAMDGFALRAADTVGAPRTLPVVATTLAGMPPATIAPGEAVRIMTGAALPLGADAVCMQELTHPAARPHEVVIECEVAAGTFVRQRGDDLRRGAVAVAARTTLAPGHLGVLASLGLTTVSVHRPARVGVLSTGDELIDPSAGPAPDTGLAVGRIYDANRPSLTGLVRGAGGAVVDLGAVPDDGDAVTDALVRGGRSCDVMIVSGGVSVGDADVVKTALGALCGRSARWMQVAVRPGKPFAFGLLPGLAPGAGAVPVFGVPGNPVSAMVSFELFARPALRLMGGHRHVDRPCALGVADEDMTRPDDGKTHFVRVRAAFGEDGLLHARPLGAQHSHLLHGMAGANALAVVPDPPGPHPGDRVWLMLLETGDIGAPGVAAVTGAA